MGRCVPQIHKNGSYYHNRTKHNCAHMLWDILYISHIGSLSDSCHWFAGSVGTSASEVTWRAWANAPQESTRTDFITTTGRNINMCIFCGLCCQLCTYFMGYTFYHPHWQPEWLLLLVCWLSWSHFKWFPKLDGKMPDRPLGSDAPTFPNGHMFYALRQRWNGSHCADDTLRYNILNENIRIFDTKFVL